MSRFHNRNFELLEPYDAKVSRTVLRGEGSSNAPDLLDLFIDDPAENLKKFEKQARNMHSLSRYSRSNQINREWIEEYLNEAHSLGLTSIRAHCNVLAWSDDRNRLKQVKNDVGSQLALMECKPRHNTVDTPTLFWAAIPGNAGISLSRRVITLSSNRLSVSSSERAVPGIRFPVRYPHGGSSDWQTRPS